CGHEAALEAPRATHWLWHWPSAGGIGQTANSSMNVPAASSMNTPLPGLSGREDSGVTCVRVTGREHHHRPVQACDSYWQELQRGLGAVACQYAQAASAGA